MKIFGKDFLFNNKKVYYEGNKPKANDIIFNDGENFQQKLDNGSLKGPKGEKGDTGSQGPAGVTGPKGADGEPGAIGPQGIDGFTWRPSVSSSGDLTWSKDSSSTTPSSINIKGPKGDKGETGAVGPKGENGKPGAQGLKGDIGPAGPRGEQGPAGPKGTDGLTTSVTINGQKYTHSGGNIKLPNFLKESGGNMTGSINNNLVTGTYLNGNKGKALLNSTCEAGAFTTLIKSNSTNGAFTLSTYNNNLLLAYTDKKSISASKNELTHRVTLISESGNSEFPNSLRAKEFLAADTIKLSKGSLNLNTISGYKTCEYVRLQNNMIACDDNKKIHFVDIDGNSSSIYASSIYNDGGITVNHKKTTTYFAIDLMRKCESNNSSGYTHSTARLGCTNTWGGAASLEYRENDATKNQIEVHDGFVRMNGKAVFIQSGTPSISTGSSTVAIPTGTVWIQV